MVIPSLLIFGVFITGLTIQPWKSRRRARDFLVIAFLALSLVSGFRAYNVGADTANYVRAYNGVNWLRETRYERGFLLFMKALHSLGVSSTGFLIISSMTAMAGICIFIYKWSKDPLLSILLYMLLRYYFGTMNTVRQGMAVAFSVLAVSKLFEKRSKKNYIISFVLIILGSLFHSSCIVMLIPWFLWVFANGKLLTNVKPVEGFIYHTLFSIAGFILFSLILRILTVVLPSYYVRYLYGTWSDTNYSASLWKMMITFIFFMVGTIYTKKREALNERDKLSIVMMGLALFFGVLSMRMEIFGRISGYFSIIVPIYWTPKFTSGICKARQRLTVKALIVIFSLIYLIVVAVYRPNWNYIVPFSFH